MTIGFGSGDFYRLFPNDVEIFSIDYINLLKADKKANAIELHCRNENQIDLLLNTSDVDLSFFKYISFHAPSLEYQKDEPSKRILSKLSALQEKYQIQNFVFHVDRVKNWDVFLDYKTLPISIENMDDRKDFGRSVEDIQSILEKYNFNLTLDLQHCFVNDESMDLATKFHNIFKDRIVEYHISGYEENYLHYPLFKTLQNRIIDSLQFKQVPIIIESTFDAKGEQLEELEYITKAL